MSTIPPGGQPRRRPSRRVVILALAGAVLVAVLLTVIILVSRGGEDGGTEGRGPAERDKVAVQYVDAINLGDPATVCRLETARQHDDQTQEACEKSNAFLRDRNVKADEPKVIQTKQLADGTGVLVEYRLTTGTKPSHDALRMVEQNGTWLVDQAESADAEAMSTADPIGAVLSDRRGA